MESERTLAERDHILAEAHAEAERIIQQAKQRAREIVSHEAIMMTAQDEVNRLLEDGRLAVHRRIEEADRYAVQVLEDLAERLQVISKQVDNGIQVMKNNRLTMPEHAEEDGS